MCYNELYFEQGFISGLAFVFGLFVLLFMVIVANPSWVSAASEAEPNDSKDTATKISLK